MISDQVQPVATAPSLLHISPAAQYSILSSFASVATSIEHLRKFVSAVFVYVDSSTKWTDRTPIYGIQRNARRNTHTLEAVSEAINAEIRRFDCWCAAKEEEICRAQAGLGEHLVTSLLSLQSALRTEFSESFTCIVDVLHDVVRQATRSQSAMQPDLLWTFPELPKRLPPASITSLLLDSLLLAIQERASTGDIITATVLQRVFRSAAVPMWNMLYRWLKDGMPISEATQGVLPAQGNSLVEEEFFIEDNELAVLDPDFWCEGFVLRSNDTGQEASEADAVENGGAAVPLFLRRIAKHVLEAGKAVGLLRVLGMPVAGDTQQESSYRWLSGWKSFDQVSLRAYARNHGSLPEPSLDEISSVASTDDFARMVYDELVSPCKQAKEMLTRVLVDECDLWTHLIAIEELYFMRQGDIMSDFVDVLFARVSAVLYAYILPLTDMYTAADGHQSTMGRLPLSQQFLRGCRHFVPF